jgi:hypothetical protein
MFFQGSDPGRRWSAKPVGVAGAHSRSGVPQPNGSLEGCGANEAIFYMHKTNKRFVFNYF